MHKKACCQLLVDSRLSFNFYSHGHNADTEDNQNRVTYHTEDKFVAEERHQ